MSRVFKSKWVLPPLLGFAAFGLLAALSFIKTPLTSDHRPFTPYESTWVPAAYAADEPMSGDYGTLIAVDRALRDVVTHSRDSVVSIQTRRNARRTERSQNGDDEPQFDLPFNFPFRIEPPESAPRSGLGSGVIISEDGYILTNNHVVGDADEIEVVLSDRRDYDARLVGSDPQSDLAVIKIDVKGLVPMPVGNSDQAQLGEFVIAIGAPFGHTHSVSFGIISAKGRSDILQNLSRESQSFEDFIQTDAAINPGNSGGPLVNIRGEFIGISTAISTQTGQSAGIGFAISSNLARKVMTDLIEHGKVSRAFLGVGIDQVDDDVAEELGLDRPRGAVVTSVMDGTPAKKAGLKPYDVILQVDGHLILNHNELVNYISSSPIGSTVVLKVLRDGKEKQFDVTLTARNEEQLAVLQQPTPIVPATTDWLGMTVEPLTKEKATELGYEGKSGVLVTSVDRSSPAGREGIQPGVLILEVAGRPVTSIAEFDAAVGASGGSALIKWVYKDNRGERFGMSVLRKPKE
ncbi:MAG: Do family serine endopeptidase [Candidatus Poribacteria bacterium]|nr:Do family serine endopeptidase [Candidatus Poribacteria bacterium]